MAKSFSGSEFAAAADATRCFGSVSTVIVDSAIAVSPVAAKHACSRDAALTAATNEVRKDGWIIATGNANIGAAGRELA
jgi:hypothetical protein